MGVVLASVVTAVVWSGCAGRSETESTAVGVSPLVEVEVVPVQRRQIESSLEVVGTLFPWKFATVAAEVTGVIESITESTEKIEYEIDGVHHSKTLPLDIGHPVKKGDVLFRINSDEAELELRSAEARLDLVQKQLLDLRAWKRPEEKARLKARLKEAEAVLADAEADKRRAETLLKQNAISSEAAGDARRAVATADAVKRQAEAALAEAEAGPTDEQIAVAQSQVDLARAEVELKRDKVAKCTVECPLETATIVERYAGVGDYVTANPSTPLMRIVDSSILLAQVGVPERYQGMIQLRDMATVHAEGGKAAELGIDGVPAMIVLVNAQIDPETRTFRVRIGLDNSQGLFTAGTFVKVKIPIRAADDTMVVPADAITYANGEPAAFVLRDDHVERRSVVLGISNRTHYEIVSGLSANDVVVKGGLSLLADGLKVRHKNAVSASTDSQG
jgi:RND family efflux transporter MFP subunit